jgi:hypothetical protein
MGEAAEEQMVSLLGVVEAMDWYSEDGNAGTVRGKET